MTAKTPEQAKAEILAIYAQRITAIKALIAEFVTDTTTYVVCTGQPAVYFKEGQAFGCGIEGASRYTLERASFWADRVYNGNLERGRVVPFGDALLNSLIDLKEAYRQIENA